MASRKAPAITLFFLIRDRAWLHVWGDEAIRVFFAENQEISGSRALRRIIVRAEMGLENGSSGSSKLHGPVLGFSEN